MANKACSKLSGTRKSSKISTAKNKERNGFPDLTELRKYIRPKGESLSETVIKGRG